MPVLWTLTTVLGIYLMYRVLTRYDLDELTAAVGAFPPANLLLAGLFTLASYTCLATAETIALRYAGQHVAPGRVAVVVAAALGIGHSIGLAALSSGAVRLRMYGRSGVPADAVARLLLFAGLTVAFGLALTAFWAAAVSPGVLAGIVDVDRGLVLLVAAIAPALAILYLLLCWRGRGRSLRLGRFPLALPPPRLAAAQLFVGTLNFSCVAAALYFCVAPLTSASYPAVAAVYTGSNAAGLIGHVPGGWGVLEYGVTTFLPGERLVAGLLVFRLVYYLVPFFIGVCTLLADELHGRFGSGGVRRAAPLLRPR